MNPIALIFVVLAGAFALWLDEVDKHHD